MHALAYIAVIDGRVDIRCFTFGVAVFMELMSACNVAKRQVADIEFALSIDFLPLRTDDSGHTTSAAPLDSRVGKNEVGRTVRGLGI